MTRGPLGGVMGSYTFDCRNRLVSAGNVSYVYDAENNRTGVIENGKLISNVVNPNAILSQGLIKTNAEGKQTYYIYGLGLIGQEEADGTYISYHYDRRGSTVAMTDINGTVTDRFQYEPYGMMTHRTGNTSTPFLYNGKYGVMTDTNSLYHMRARYYNPEIRRFINQDIMPGSIVNGQSLNRYAFVNGQPVSYMDPFGLSPDGDTPFVETSPDLLPPAEMWSPEYLRDSQRAAAYVMVGSISVVTAGLGAELLSAGSSVIPAAREFVNKGTTRAKAGGNLANQTREQLLRSKASYEKLIKEHQAKLQEYIKNPDAFDNQGLLKNTLTPEIRQKIIGGRIRQIEKQIIKQQRELEKIIEILE